MNEVMIKHYYDIIHSKERELQNLLNDVEYKQKEIEQLNNMLKELLTLIVN